MPEPTKRYRATVTVVRTFEVELDAASQAEATDQLRTLDPIDFEEITEPGDGWSVSLGSEAWADVRLTHNDTLDFGFVQEVQA